MTYKTLLYEKADGIARVTLNRPESLNALNSTVYNELYDVFEAIENDADVRVVILTGSGEKAFAAGSDVVEMKNMNTLDIQKFVGTIRKASDRIYNLTKPTIAAINGYALGGGCELSMCCDLRICSEKARFGQPEINLGLIPGACGTQRLPRLIGAAKAKELIFLGDMIDAATALNLGLVNKVVPPEKLIEEAMEWAKKLASKSSPVLAMAKMAINTGIDTDVNSGLNIEARCVALCFATEDQKEGMKAFLEKRKAEFKNK
ncbi:MAG TPA: enoyl-CoA hydratase-related protein [Dehalococcoidales bacterium]|nr:enoyl-CoA hydratase-related protein [Dehalococcoidales bacterium]